jgi:hypothetical protein
MSIRRVEYIRAWEDGTWDTVIEAVAVPDYMEFGAAREIVLWLEQWAERHLYQDARFRKVVYWGVMNENVTEVES